jgi:GNAT superfamily N-acetyltransferase
VGVAEAAPPPFGAPEPLADHHDLAAFQSGETVLDEWLRRRARANQAGGASRTYVLCRGERVLGYYSLASGAIALVEAPGRIRRNMPDPIPMTVLGRLAIDLSCQGQGLGRLLLRDAILRTVRAADIIGVRGLLVHAISPTAKRFYEANGFQESPADPMTLLVALKDVASVLRGPEPA